MTSSLIPASLAIPSLSAGSNVICGALANFNTMFNAAFGISGVAFMWLFWVSPYAGPPVVILLAAGGACYIAGAIVYALRKPDPWPRVFGFHEIFHCGTVAGYACQMVAIYMVIVSLWQ